MPTNSPNKSRICTLIPTGASVVVIVLMLASWSNLTQETQQPKKSKTPPRLPVKIPVPPKHVTLPPPPERLEPHKKIAIAILKPVSKTGSTKPNQTFKALTPQKSQPSIKNILPPFSASQNIVAKGRTLLRLLEHGAGPSIEFAWPDLHNEKSRLYRILVKCHQMRVALLDEQGQLFVKESLPGVGWPINLDRYSTFMRHISGPAAKQENQEIVGIRKRQLGLKNAAPVRLFTRHLDAFVLGSIGQIIGARYRSVKSIRARYDLSGDTIYVTDITGDGRAYAGAIGIACSRGRGM